MRRAWLLDRDDQEVQDTTPEAIAEYEGRHFTYHSRGFNARTGGVPCFSKCLFFGEANNSRIGLCPHTARTGDIVVMFHGGPVLYILREKKPPGQGESQPQEREAQWYFVGECYLVGYMHGQALSEAEEGGLEKEIFALV